MHANCPASKLHRAAVLVAALLGLLGLFAGGRVLLGLASPGHPVLRPLLLFNTIMGAVYVLAALRIRADPLRGRVAALSIALLNAGVLAALVVYAGAGGIVAPDSLLAMTVRTGAWSAIYLVLGRILRPAAAA